MKICFFTLITVAILNITEVSALASEFKLYLDESRTKHIMVEKQDCSVYKSKNGKVTLGFKAGGLFFGIGVCLLISYYQSSHIPLNLYFFECRSKAILFLFFTKNILNWNY